MNRNLLHISIKMAIVGIIALFVAYFVGIKNYTTASAIGILSVQWTKRDFFSIAIKRTISGIAAIIVSALIFHYFGQSFIMYVLFMVVFITASWFLNAPEGIVPSMVIVAHIFLIPVISIPFILEEIGLLIIAIVIAFIVNMLYPQFNMKNMKENLNKVDYIIETQLTLIISKLNKEDVDIKIDSKKEMNTLLTNSQMIDRDIIVQNDHRYITYLNMRDTQLKILRSISREVDKIKFDHSYSQEISQFLVKIRQNIGHNDNATPLLKELENLNLFFINSELPKTRQEFEVRAILFQILSEMKSFLEIKTEFHIKYPNFTEDENNADI